MTICLVQNFSMHNASLGVIWQSYSIPVKCRIIIFFSQNSLFHIVKSILSHVKLDFWLFLVKMPRTYVRKTPTTDQNHLYNALLKIKVDGMSVINMAAVYNIKQRTLFRLSKNFDEWMAKDEEITETKVKEFFESKKDRTVSLNLIR